MIDERSHERLESFAADHGVDVDTLADDVRPKAVEKLRRVEVLAGRTPEHADALRSEVAGLLGVSTAVEEADHMAAARVSNTLAGYDLETLNDAEAVARELDGLPRRIEAASVRVPEQADTLARRHACLTALLAELEAGARFDSVDALAHRLAADEPVAPASRP